MVLDLCIYDYINLVASQANNEESMGCLTSKETLTMNTGNTDERSSNVLH